MFMVLHLSPANFPHTFALGVATGFMRARTGSLLPGMVTHFVHNLLCVTIDPAEWGC
jgi:membrane protease YdiL (CAAX protease family)